MALTTSLTHGAHNIVRRYSAQVPRDPRYRLKATLMTTYVFAAFTLPFVPPVLETRRSRADGSNLTRYVSRS